MEKDATKPAKRWITAKEASLRVPWTYKHFLKMISAGQVPQGVAVQPAGGRTRVLIDSDAFDRWLENGCFTARPDGDGEHVA